MHVDRRRVIGLGAGLVTAGVAGGTWAASGSLGARGRLLIDPAQVLGQVPASYGGFSVELATLADPEVFHPANHGMIALYRRLSTQGVLRLGGNSSELCWWQGTPDQEPPSIHPAGVGRADNWMPQRLTPITPAAIDNLRGFLDATGWSCIYGLPFGTGSPAADAAHAGYVARVLGPRLRYLQIGNEPDFYQEPNNLLRPPGWGFEDYLREWMAIADAICATVPQARFGGPDVGSSADWVVRFAQAVGPVMRERLVELTGHYYAEGPPDSPQASIGNLLAADPRVTERMAAIMPVARQLGVSFRMSEGNSCFRGGKAGLSNALAGALWGMDYMLAMAALGCTGINFHGGGGSVISSALGDKLPGARDARDLAIAQLGSFYSPIAGNRQAGYTARPLFYAMMAVETFAGCSLAGTTFNSGGSNASAYAGRGGDGWRIAIVNKDLRRDLTVELPSPPFAGCSIWRLTGPAIEATVDISLAGGTIRGPGSQWQPGFVETARSGPRPMTIRVPHASACLLLERS